MKFFFLFCLSAISLLFTACTVDEEFSTSKADLLTFSTDTVSLDTVFSAVPSSTFSFWIFNNNSKGLNCASVRLKNGNQTGFRVNVNGTYLSSVTGFRTNNVEIRHGDSIRVFVAVTTPEKNNIAPSLVSDDLVFTLESGSEQSVNLNVYSWDAVKLENMNVTGDTIIDASEKPVVVYGTLNVAAGATLTFKAGSNIYFHSGAGIDVYGTLCSMGKPGNEVVMRSDRLDRMFDYLPYDRVSGLWNGIHIYGESFNNAINYTDLHSAFNGIVCDSSDVDRTKLFLRQSTVHNCQGNGVYAKNCNIEMQNCQITNALNNCMAVYGGKVYINACTFGQFYPFNSDRGAAFLFSSSVPLHELDVNNCIITGYADDVLTGIKSDSVFNYKFSDCIIRTPNIETADSVNFNNVTFENLKDTLTTAEKMFSDIDINNQYYDFHLADKSSAIGKANKSTTPSMDRDGRERDDEPDLGAYEK